MLKTVQGSIILTLILVFIVGVVILAAIIYVLPKMVTKGVNVAGDIAIAKNALNDTNNVIKVADSIIPNNPAINILKVIETFAQKGVDGAEQLYVSSKLAADERNANAKEMINSALNVLDVKVTPDIQTVINGTIEAAVLALPKVAETDIQKQAEKAKILATNTQLVAQNSQLTQQLAQLKSAIGAIK